MSSAPAIFENCQIYIVPNGLLKKRIKLFEEQVIKHGGKIVTNVRSTTPTHVIVEENYLINVNQVKNVLKVNKLEYEDLKCDIVGTLWLSRCIKEKNLLDTEHFKFKYKRKIEHDNPVVEDGTSNKIQRIEVIPSDSSSKDLAMVIAEFQKLAEAYRATGDRWRTLAYDKAIASLKSWRKPFFNINDLKLLPHISGKMFNKIEEILENGSCSKVEEICSDEKTRILQMFINVWGAGNKTAEIWYQKGYRTLEDLRGNVTWQQELGLKYYNDIQIPIPRQEVEQIVAYVKKAVKEVDSKIRVMACGSFRRGKSTCGDVDVLVIAQHSTYLLHKILEKLRNFLVSNLRVKKDAESSTYYGLCKLPGENRKIRRLDIFVVNDNMVGCALVHYTGSAFFNRGIRIHARKMNMKLTEYRLTCNGQELPTPTEESVFEHLKLEYRRPEDRETFHVY